MWTKKYAWQKLPGKFDAVPNLGRTKEEIRDMYRRTNPGAARTSTDEQLVEIYRKTLNNLPADWKPGEVRPPFIRFRPGEPPELVLQ